MVKRIAALDVFRGLMLLSMTFNHLIIFPFASHVSLNNFVQTYVYNKVGYLSNSEGFFFLSGIAAGIAYSKLHAPGALWTKVIRRIRQMYCIHLALLLLFSLAITFSSTYWMQWKAVHQIMDYWRDAPGIHYYLDNPWNAFALGACFLYFPPLFDMLPLYMLFLLCTPFLLHRFAKGQTLHVLVASALLWLSSQYWPPGLVENSLGAPIKLNWFHPLAVQILFVSGLAIGFMYKRESLWPLKKIYAVVCCFLAGSYCILLVSKAAFRDTAIYDVQLDVPRLTFFLIKAMLATAIASKVSFRPLELLGQNALLVFSYHIVLTYALMYFLLDIADLTLPMQLLILVASHLSLWLPVMKIEYKSTHPIPVRSFH